MGGRKMTSDMKIVYGTMLLIINYFILHAVHVSDASKAQNMFGGSSKPITGIAALFAGFEEGLSHPFNLAGTNPLHALVYCGLITAGYILVLYGWQLDRDRNYNEKWYKHHTHWLGEPTPLLNCISPYEVGYVTQEKNPETGEMEDVFHSDVVMADDWGGYQKYMVTPYTQEDKDAGLPDMNFLIGRFPAGASMPREDFIGKLLGKRIPLHGDVKYSMDPGKTNRNLLTLVIGGSGKGKTFKDLEPNLAQMNCSFAITDPSGEIYENMGKMLLEDGYRVWRFATSDPKYSNCYNPLDYIYDEDGNPDQVKVAQVVNIFIKNSKEAGSKGGDPFWTKSATAWLTFAILYLVEFLNREERNFYQVLKLAQLGKSDEESSSSQSQLDKIVEQAKNTNPNAKCFEYYDIFAIAPAKTRNSIMISIGVDVSPFAQDELRNLTSTSYLCKRDKKGFITEYIKDSKNEPIPDTSNIDLRTIGDRKTALFIIPKTANDSYQFLVSIMYSQLFDILYERAEKVAKNSWHIYASNGTVLTSEYPTKEIAQEWLDLYANSEVREVQEKDVTRYYLYNAKADKAHTLPEKRIGKKSDIGIIEEVYSREVGEKLIKQYQQASVKHGKLRLPIHTRLLLDEFANISEIPNFEQFLSTMRKYQISCTIILQTIAQIKQKYDKSAPTIIGNCDTIMFLGSSDIETCKTISERLGKTVYKTVKTSQSKQNNGGSVSMNYDVLEKPLMEPDALARLANNKVITMITGLNPMLLDKLNFAEHPNWKKSGAYKDENKLLKDFTEAHYKCTSKIRARNEKRNNIESESIELQNNNKSPYTKKPTLKRRTKGSPIKDRGDMAQALGTTEPKLDEVLKNPITLSEADRSETNTMQPVATPNNETDMVGFDFHAPATAETKTEEQFDMQDDILGFEDNNETTNNVTTGIDAAAENAAQNDENTSSDNSASPNSDTTWLFM